MLARNRGMRWSGRSGSGGSDDGLLEAVTPEILDDTLATDCEVARNVQELLDLGVNLAKCARHLDSCGLIITELDRHPDHTAKPSSLPPHRRRTQMERPSGAE